MDKPKEWTPEEPTDAEKAFEAEIRAKHPKRKRFKRVVMPPSNRDDVFAVYIAKLQTRDELTAAAMADVLMTDLQRKSVRLALEAEQNESVKLSVVGVVDVKDGGPGACRHIDHASVWVEPNDWGQDTWLVVRSANLELHGVDQGELGKAVRGVAASANGATPSETGATPAGVSSNK